MSNSIQAAGSNPVAQLKKFLDAPSVIKRLEDTLGKRAGAFSNSIINVYKSNALLQKCNHDSVLSAAMVAATMNLPIDPALGYAAIVPYGATATFQIMYKGITQLCIRSNQYKSIHCSEVYADEIASHNPITGEVTFNDPKTYKMRYEGNFANVAGHYAYFKLISGFEKSDYMPKEEAIAHARKYSKAYQNDLKYKKESSPWSTDPVPMGNKTVLLRLLGKYGVMSIEMQEAVSKDRDSFETSQDHADKTIEDDTGSDIIDVPAMEIDETVEDVDVKTVEAAVKADAKVVVKSTKGNLSPKAQKLIDDLDASQNDRSFLE